MLPVSIKVPRSGVDIGKPERLVETIWHRGVVPLDLVQQARDLSAYLRGGSDSRPCFAFRRGPITWHPSRPPSSLAWASVRQ
jgi:hypothetical protein